MASKSAQMNLAHAEEHLALKKVWWYECVMFGGAGLTLGIAYFTSLLL